MKSLVRTSDGWDAQVTLLSEMQKLLAKAIELERTGVGVKRTKKRSHKSGHEGGYSGKRVNELMDLGDDERHNVLSNIATLVPLIESENEYVRHSAKKTLCAASEYYILTNQKQLWFCLVVHIWDSMILMSRKLLIVDGKEDRKGHLKEDILIKGSEILSESPKASDVCPAKQEHGCLVCGLEVLRCILKTCTDDFVVNDDNIQSFLGLLEKNICNVMQIIVPKGSIGADSCCLKRGLAWGAFLQLLCTTIRCCNWEFEHSVQGEPMLETLLVEKIWECIPVLACITLSPHRHSLGVSCPSLFLRHKVLQLLLGISRWFEYNHDLSLTCLRALRSQGADLIGFSVLKNAPVAECMSVTKSSFSSTLVIPQDVSDEFESHISSHLHCRALLLLFQIWSVAASGIESSEISHKFIRVTRVMQNNIENGKAPDNDVPESSRELLSNSVANFDSGLKSIHKRDQEECISSHLKVSGMLNRESRSTGKTGTDGGQERPLSKYTLSREANEGIREWLELQSVEITADKIQDFSMMFLGLYSDEDNIMIEILLLMFNIRPLLLSIVETELTNCVLVITALGPAELFHAFLATLSYDHTVLVDFLISQDSGTLFLRYLMLCTGFIVNTWPEFYNKAKHPSSVEGKERASQFSSEKAMCCMVELKAAIDRLQRRNLFPYNPLPLLKRLGMLQDIQQQSI